MTPLYQTDLREYQLLFRGKVRDVYDLRNELLIVATDRLSAFDVVLPDPIPEKGRVLTEITNFWMEKFKSIVPNHGSGRRLVDVIRDPRTLSLLQGRAVVVRKAKPILIECVVRGYLIGSGWKDYQKTGAVSGIALPPGLKQAERLPEPIFTPSSKAAVGVHDENITYDDVVRFVGPELARKLRDLSLALYKTGAKYAEERGIIMADTKFEFGTIGDRLTLIDEVMTPDSSRFWPKSEYHPGISPPSFDKQFVRDYLETIPWNKTAPGPHLPEDVIAKTSEKYQEALRILTQA